MADNDFFWYEQRIEYGQPAYIVYCGVDGKPVSGFVPFHASELLRYGYDPQEEIEKYVKKLNIAAHKWALR